MKTYEFIKSDSSRWWFFYDRSIRLWTAYQVDPHDYQISEADHYHDKKQMVAAHGFDFKNVI